MKNSVASAYDRTFFKRHVRRPRKSADVVVPLLGDLLQPSSVVDFGCGVGTWLSVFRDHGVTRVLGLDGPWVPSDLLQISINEFVEADLAVECPVPDRFDLAISLEVAEHLPEYAATLLVHSLTQSAAAVAFSAAIPHQGGVRHLNEQWPDYWAELFALHEFEPVDCIRPQIWNNPQIEWWYAQNLLLFVHADLLAGNPQLQRWRSLTRDNQLAVVHPRAFIRASTAKASVDIRQLGALARRLPSAVISALTNRARRNC